MSRPSEPHKTDLQIWATALDQIAEDQSLCSDFEREMQKMNGELSIKLPPPKKKIKMTAQVQIEWTEEIPDDWDQGPVEYGYKRTSDLRHRPPAEVEIEAEKFGVVKKVLYDLSVRSATRRSRDRF